MRADISTVGIDGGNQPRRVAAAATRFYAGEPANFAGTNTAGVASVNTVVALTDAKPRVATDSFQGIFASDAPVNAAGTVVAGKVYVTVPIPDVTRIRGRAKVAANVDTDSELLGVLFDYLDFDLTAGVYTIDDVAASNASGLMCVDGNPAKSTLDVVVDARALRYAIA